jgi:tetratricopeptide (TPR) repeat protein
MAGTMKRGLASRTCVACALACATGLAAPTQPGPPSTERSAARAAAPASPPTDPPSKGSGRSLADQLREAADRHERAFRLYDEGAYDAALSELKRAYELAPTFRILYNLGVMSLAVHDHAGAMDYLERYVAEGADAIPANIRAQVSDTLLELAERVAQVSLQVNVAGAEVSIDDRVIGRAPLDRVLRINAGSRRISARASGWLPDSRVVSLAGGDDVKITLTLTDARAPMPTILQKNSDRSLPWLGFGATALLAAGSVVSGIEALSAQNDFDRKRRTLGIRARDLEQADAKAFRWSVAADALGLAALASGGYSLYIALSPHETEKADAALGAGFRVDFGATGCVLHGVF